MFECWKPQEPLEPLLGQNPFQKFDLASRQMPGPLGSRTMVLWDLTGKVVTGQGSSCSEESSLSDTM
jgi:hypothetical protein